MHSATFDACKVLVTSGLPSRMMPTNLVYVFLGMLEGPIPSLDSGLRNYTRGQLGNSAPNRLSLGPRKDGIIIRVLELPISRVHSLI